MKNRNTIAVYFISKTYGEFRAKTRADRIKAYSEGSAFKCDCFDEDIELITLDKPEAVKEFNDYKMRSREFKNAGMHYIFVEDYAIICRTYNFDAILEENENITNKSEFIEQLKADPWGDLSYNQIEEYVIQYAERNFTVKLERDDGDFEKNFTDYEEACDWLEEQEIRNGDSINYSKIYAQ